MAHPPSTSDAPLGVGPAAEPSPLTAGFYQLTLLGALLSTVEVRLRVTQGLPSLSVAELVVLPVLLCVLVELSLRPRLTARFAWLYRQNRPLAWYAGYAGMAAVVGLSRSGDGLSAFHDLLCALSLYALIALTIDTHARLLGLLLVNLAGVLLSVGFGLLQITTGGPYVLPRSEIVDGKLDLAGNVAQIVPTGLYAHPNAFVMLIPVVLFLLVAMARGLGHRRRHAAVLLGVIGAMFVVLGMAYVKGVYAWLLAGVAFLLLPRPFDRLRFCIAVFVPVAGIVALIWISVDSFLEGESVFGTVVFRLALWLTSLEIIASDGFVAVVGSGITQLPNRLFAVFEYPNAHNAWLNQALTYGVPALVLYLAAIVRALRSLSVRVRLDRHPSRTVALAAMASIMAVVGDSFFEPLDRGVMYQAQLFTLLAIAAVLPGLSAAQDGPGRQRT